MNEVFADTSGLLDYPDSAQPGHQAALAAVRAHLKTDGNLITTNYVLTELVALFSSRSRVARPQIFQVIEALISSPRLSVVHVDNALHDEAWELLKARPDKEWSWVDAVSFVLMQNRHLDQALTSAHHFEQAGFRRLLAP